MTLRKDTGEGDGRGIGAEQMGGGEFDQNSSYLCVKFSKNEKKSTLKMKLGEVEQSQSHCAASSV